MSDETRTGDFTPQCNCGFGGFHEPLNMRCDRSIAERDGGHPDGELVDHLARVLANILAGNYDGEHPDVGIVIARYRRERMGAE